jgi:outer membrane protein, heavy metal efflux system
MFIRLSFLLSIAGAASAWAGSVSFSVEGAADYALRNNPTLAVARLRIEEARGRLEQSGRFTNPEFEFDFARNTTGREGTIALSLIQRFPLTARLRHEKAVSRAELAAAEAEVRDGERRLAAEVRAAAVKLLALEGQRELRTRQLANSRELSAFLLRRVETGEAAAVDASQVELETRQIEIENLQLATEEVALIGELRPMLGLSGEAVINITGILPAPASLPAVGNVANRPDVQAAKARADAASAAVLQQRASRWEDIGIGAIYERERTKDEPDPTETEHIVGFKVSVPLPVWNINSGRIREAEAAAVRAAKEVSAASLTAGAEAAAARAEMAAQARLIRELNTTVLPKAAQIEEQLRNNYSVGQTALTDVLRARSRRLELERVRLDALRDYHLARVRHFSATTAVPSTSQKLTK